MAQRETFVVRQRRLRAELRRFREAAGRTQRAVAEALGWSTSKLIRIETGAVNVATSDVMALLHFYGISDPDVAEDLVAATRSRSKDWWAEYRSVFSQQFLNFLGYEDSAIRIRGYMTLLVPGLLQTEEYATALLTDYEPERHPDLGLHIRMRRQEKLDRPNCPELLYILDEAVIHRRVGGPDVMLRQLVRLKELARHPRISLRIVPFSAGMYAGMQGASFTIFEFPADDDVITVVEEPRRDVIVDDSEVNHNYIRKFSELQKTACRTEGEADEIIDSVIDRMRLGATV
ncbi:MAG TPA: helix-turn-helix transcriptional regulator [Actinophytocola sp.]|jgi:transcriptional regulator with XRE-family HTH domain|uniref:helix-turn-helix domain-containing protein n=1 Tax=Actinophytocola sp. TaxID=1872138 RepID=UPI002DF8BD65|nr:helix-turn-helix transcriptional regulator [Actinophytocola sp.]